MTTYLNRKSILEDATYYRLDPTGISLMSEKDGEKGHIPYSSIRSLHLSFAPSRVQANRYLADIGTSSGKFRLSSERYLGPMEFEDQGSQYREWLRELQQRLLQAGVPVQCRGGASSLSWWLNLGCLGSVLIGLIALGIVLFAALHLLVIVKLAIIAFFLPRAYRWFKQNRPATFPLGMPPSELLPASVHGKEGPPPLPPTT